MITKGQSLAPPQARLMAWLGFRPAKHDILYPRRTLCKNQLPYTYTFHFAKKNASTVIFFLFRPAKRQISIWMRSLLSF